MKIKEATLGFDGDIVLTLKFPISERPNIEPTFAILDDINPDAEYEFTVKKQRKKRSQDANSYLWVLCDKIAQVTRATKEEIYRKAIREVGVFSDVAVQEGEPCQALVKSWSANGIGYFAEVFNSRLQDKDGNPMKRVRLYEGSHQYNSKQMSRCIDYVIEEAQNLGLPTMTPNQLEEIKAQWNMY